VIWSSFEEADDLKRIAEFEERVRSNGALN